MTKKIYPFMLLVLLLAGCANPNQKRNEQVVNNATQELKFCLESQSSQGKKADCAQNFYGALGGISDDDYGKLPALRLATALYALLVKVDRGQINESDAKIEFMRISNEFQTDLNNAQRRSNAENRAAAMQQQQLFLNAQRMLSPPGSIVNCYRAPGSPVTSCY